MSRDGAVSKETAMMRSTAFAILLLTSSSAALAQYIPNDPYPTHQQPQISPENPRPANPRAVPEELGTTGQAIRPDGGRLSPQNDPNSPACIPQYDSSGAQVKPCPNLPR
jgi:hypothetical protein